MPVFAPLFPPSYKSLFRGKSLPTLLLQLRHRFFSVSTADTALPPMDASSSEVASLSRRLQTVITTNGGGAGNREAFRQAVVNTLERRLFYIPSFKIYRGVAGLYDYGPPGCAVKSNVLAFWRQHFVLEENMLEVDCPCVTPEIVLKASGHVEKFTDLMFNEFKHVLAVLDDLSAEELGAKLKQYGITAPDTNNPLSDPYPFNLMFQTSIGPSGLSPGYMRPETAQGIFVNFKDLYYYNGNRLPFAAAQIGQAFRNEELQLAGESSKSLVLGEAVKKVWSCFMLTYLLAYHIGLLYLLLMLLFNCIEKERLRFCSICQNEMAHYAADCWDAEIECSYGWIECVGIADRSAYDLHAHTEKSGVPLVAHEKYPEPREVEKLVITPSKKELGLAFKGSQKMVVEALEAMSEAEALEMQTALESKGEVEFQVCTLGKSVVIKKNMVSICKEKKKEHHRKELGLAFKGSQKMVVEALEAMSEAEALEMQTALESKGEVEFQVCTLGKSVVIKKNMVSICKEKKKEHHRVFTPSVIEPSFGIGRIIYCLFEHCFYTRPNKSEDEQLNVFRFPPLVAPIKCTVFPLVKSQKFDETAKDISKSLTTAGISHIIDITGTSIGKRYARTDEIGVPFAITVDSTTTVTIRERDSKEQIRVSVDEVASVVKEVTDGQSTWADIMWRFPAHSVSHAEET
ncbi:hypothetical protein HPP92_000336 [Vanilla planifolia]|uniref:Aminoacyl-transfer RNA synthetases class-II family profile domain-containing protein n=1 Tax=Vanilla planifolia TaxID=51239 RepID=A0A835S2N5_VANPL|nr:hypothetical protein HPP92_000336 [Vanilla planifolia]